MQTLVLLHPLMQRSLKVFLRHALINQLVAEVILGKVVLFLLELLVEGEDAALLVEAVLHLEEDGGDVQQDQHIVIEACVLATLLVKRVAIVADMRHQLRLRADIHRPQLITHDVD